MRLRIREYWSETLNCLENKQFNSGGSSSVNLKVSVNSYNGKGINKMMI